jgi:hypothetical protein
MDIREQARLWVGLEVGRRSAAERRATLTHAILASQVSAFTGLPSETVCRKQVKRSALFEVGQTFQLLHNCT